jgi:class I fructose-bisphosphate aldolase
MNSGRLARTGYLSLLPFDHGIAFGAGSAFVSRQQYFDPETALELAVEGGCSGVVSTFGVLGAIARKYAHKIPLVLKFNHDEQLTYPQRNDNVLFSTRVEDAWNMGCVGVAATVFFGSNGTTQQLQVVSDMFSCAHELGMATILFCYIRAEAFRKTETNYELAADATGQANHLGATIEADILKQKLPETNGAFKALGDGQSSYGKLDECIYTELMSDHPIDMTRYQVMNGFSGKIPLVSSGGPSGADDLRQAVRAAVVNKRAGGAGLIAGRKAFQRPLSEGVAILNAIQDVYLNEDVTVA